MLGIDAYLGRAMTLTTLRPRVATLGNRTAIMVPGSWRTDKQGSTARGYGYKWQQAREGWLRKHPLCVYCERDGRVTPASVIDHIEPHRGDMVLFWAADTNWQSLCKPCHDAKTALEDGGFGNAPKQGGGGSDVWRLSFARPR